MAGMVIQHACIVERGGEEMGEEVGGGRGRGEMGGVGGRGSSPGSSSNLEHIFSINESKPSVSRLEIVESL